MKRISLNKVMAKLAEEQKVDLAQMDILKMLSGSLQGPRGFWQNNDAARKLLMKAIREISDNNKLLNQDIKMLDDKLALAKELGVDDVIQEINRVKGIAENTIKEWNGIMNTVDNAWTKLGL